MLRLLVLGTLGGAAFQVGMVYAVALSGATLAAFAAGVYPLLAVAGAGVLLGEHPGRLVFGALESPFSAVSCWPASTRRGPQDSVSPSAWLPRPPSPRTCWRAGGPRPGAFRRRSW